MIYLKHGRSLEIDKWSEAYETDQFGTFMKKLLIALFPGEELAQRCVVEGPGTRTPEGKNLRKKFSPKEMDILGSTCITDIIPINSPILLKLLSFTEFFSVLPILDNNEREYYRRRECIEKREKYSV